MTLSPSMVFPCLVHQQAAVGVAVEGDAQIIPAGDDSPGQGLQMGGAAAVVDVDAVRLRVDEVRLKRERPEQVRRGGAGRAVGAVHQHPQAGQVAVDAAQQMLHIGAVQGVHTVVAAAHGRRPRRPGSFAWFRIRSSTRPSISSESL